MMATSCQFCELAVEVNGQEAITVDMMVSFLVFSKVH